VGKQICTPSENPSYSLKLYRFACLQFIIESAKLIGSDCKKVARIDNWGRNIIFYLIVCWKFSDEDAPSDVDAFKHRLKPGMETKTVSTNESA